MISTAKRALILASFADMVSGSDSLRQSGHNAGAMFFHPHIPTQGRLHCTQHTILCTALQVLTKSVRERNPQRVICRRRTEEWSPRRAGRMPHAIGARPLSLTPSIHPKLGVTSRHKGLHRCALRRIFRPCLEKGALTRILRRQCV